MLLSLFIFSCETRGSNTKSDQLTPQDVKHVVEKVIGWQMKEFPNMNNYRKWKNTSNSWVNASFLYGLAEWNDLYPNDTIQHFYEEMAKDLNYTLPNKFSVYHADEVAICMLYAKIYEKYKDDYILQHTMERLEYVAQTQTSEDFSRPNPIRAKCWSWCDALYMAPPIYATIGRMLNKPHLIEFMDREFWATYNYLYDKEEHLFYRDDSYFNKKEKNGKKVFWGRGNGWVIGGLVQIISSLPDDFQHKDKYIQLFVEMMTRLSGLQDENGYWHASLLDPASYPSPETSSTGFLAYGLWWGINQGYLDKSVFLASAKKSWSALVAAVHENGMLGWVQPVGQDPTKVTKDMTEVYGSGAFILTGLEVVQFLDALKNR